MLSVIDNNISFIVLPYPESPCLLASSDRVICYFCHQMTQLHISLAQRMRQKLYMTSQINKNWMQTVRMCDQLECSEANGFQTFYFNKILPVNVQPQINCSVLFCRQSHSSNFRQRLTTSPDIMFLLVTYCHKTHQVTPLFNSCLSKT